MHPRRRWLLRPRPRHIQCLGCSSWSRYSWSGCGHLAQLAHSGPMVRDRRVQKLRSVPPQQVFPTRRWPPADAGGHRRVPSRIQCSTTPRAGVSRSKHRTGDVVRSSPAVPGPLKGSARVHTRISTAFNDWTSTASAIAMISSRSSSRLVMMSCTPIVSSASWLAAISTNSW